ncbi:MarR family winged helix-turn-helix transcriptional regulator [Calidifontibacter indicus]|uniref:DNA-binding MarR family transcriptional regulator n=1 Tax=Calidifontibacter indicus TaxID=419650 RepID=A0A3D9UJ02_9MICO|nr:MarR family transcriptional regulator [Calidifontibacter indicus]REF29299.1 DNA-binding MarR family transcriptional regulator [Calidifontibacter indicus]
MTEAPSRLAADPIAVARDEWERRGWADAAPGMAAVTSLMRAQQIVAARVDAALKPFGVTFARYELLMLLTFSRKGTLPMKLIGSRLQVHPTSVTNAVDRLEAAGLVTRSTHPDDRRAFIVGITDQGRDLAARATDALNAQVFAAPGLTPTDLEALVDVIGRMRSDAGDF